MSYPFEILQVWEKGLVLPCPALHSREITVTLLGENNGDKVCYAMISKIHTSSYEISLEIPSKSCSHYLPVCVL